MLFRSVSLIIVIGLELLKLLKLHLAHHRLRAEVVIEVAIIAVCNKVVTLDLKALDGVNLARLGGLIARALRGVLHLCQGTGRK